jgi:hypothetical protein
MNLCYRETLRDGNPVILCTFRNYILFFASFSPNTDNGLEKEIDIAFKTPSQITAHLKEIVELGEGIPRKVLPGRHSILTNAPFTYFRKTPRYVLSNTPSTSVVGSRT